MLWAGAAMCASASCVECAGFTVLCMRVSAPAFLGQLSQAYFCYYFHQVRWVVGELGLTDLEYREPSEHEIHAALRLAAHSTGSGAASAAGNVTHDGVATSQNGYAAGSVVAHNATDGIASTSGAAAVAGDGKAAAAAGGVPLPAGWQAADAEASTLQLFDAIVQTPAMHSGVDQRAALKVGLLGSHCLCTTLCFWLPCPLLYSASAASVRFGGEGRCHQAVTTLSTGCCSAISLRLFMTSLYILSFCCRRRRTFCPYWPSATRPHAAARAPLPPWPG